MVFYFSGTGNSLYVAQNIALNQNDNVLSVAECLKNGQFEFTLAENEAVGFVFPIYFYGMSTILLDFVSKMKIGNYQPDTFIYSICTCGGSTGNAMNRLKGLLRNNQYHLNSGYSVIMPDNYILMFNLLPEEKKQEEILKLAETQLTRINKYISDRTKDSFILDKGAFPRLMTFTSYPLYQLGRSTKPFHTTGDCIGCGLCERICPCSMIHLVSGVPIWDEGKCTQCLACIHRCPVKAIQHGKKTYNRGRYINPNCHF